MFLNSILNLIDFKLLEKRNFYKILCCDNFIIMNLHLMKFVDKYAGRLICTGLTCIEFFVRSFRKKFELDPKNVRNILIIKFWGIGSIILSTPLIVALHDKFPEAEISFLTLRKNKEMLNLLPHVNKIITLDIDHGYFNFIKSFVKSVLEMRRMKLDIVFDLEFFTRFSAIVTYFSGAKEKIGFKAWEVWRGNLHTIGIPFNRYWHIKQNFFNLGTAVGISPNSELELSEPELGDAKGGADSLLRGYNLKPKEYICMNPNAGELALSRKWPKENFAELTKKILEKQTEVKVVYLGSSKESEYVKSIILSIGPNPKLIDSSGELSLKELLIVLKNAKLLVSNDSGPLHLAVALKTPTVSFFGPETPVLYGHSGKNNIVFFKNLDCSPCINVHETKTHHCYKKIPDCLNMITSAEVYAEIKKLIG